MALKRLISQVKRLPASPQVLPRMNLLKDTNATSTEIVGAIKVDMSLAVQVQRLSNSSYYGFAEPSQDLSQTYHSQNQKRLQNWILKHQLFPVSLRVQWSV